MSEERIWPFGKPADESADSADAVVSKKPSKKANDVKEGDADGSAQE